jgi:hypothetical protein
MANSPLEPCPGCRAALPRTTGPVHRYLESSPACWQAYGEVLQREYSDPERMTVHRLTVDAYAVQHPGRPSPQSIRSVAVHLLSLRAVFELGLSPAAATARMAAWTRAAEFHWLTPPEQRGELTVLTVLPTSTVAEHLHAVREWARSAYLAWTPHHAQLAHWAEQARRGAER